VDASPDQKIPDDLHATGLACGYQVVQNPVDHILVEGPFVPIGPEVEFQGFQLYAKVRGGIDNPNRGEIGLAGARTEAREFRTLEADFILSSGSRIRKDLKRFDRLGGQQWLLSYRKVPAIIGRPLLEVIFTFSILPYLPTHQLIAREILLRTGKGKVGETRVPIDR
jgi:hypothetical protein